MASKKALNIHVSESFFPLSEFKLRASELLKRVKEGHEAVVITQHGKPSGVLIPTEEFDRYRAREEFIAALTEGRADAREGRTTPTSELKEKLAKKFKRS